MESLLSNKVFTSAYFESRYRNKRYFFSALSRRQYLYKARIKFIRKIAGNRDAALEVGCGLGDMSVHLANYFGMVDAIDVADEALDQAATQSARSNIAYQLMDCCELSFEKERFDFVFAFDVVEHLNDPSICFQQIFDVLKPGGHLLFSTPNRGSFGSWKKGGEHANFGATLDKRKHQWFGWQDDTHCSVMYPDEWRELLYEEGFRIVSDGTDYLWDSPYFRYLPVFPQDLFCKLSHRMLTKLKYFMNWKYGENFICLAQK